MSAEGQIARGGVGEPTVDGTPSEIQSEQYSLAKILGIWALAAAPMGIVGWMGWFVSPLLASQFGLDSLGVFVTRLVLLMLGLIWLFVLSIATKPLARSRALFLVASVALAVLVACGVAAVAALEPAKAAFPGTNGAIAFLSSGPDGTQQVYRMRADGSGERRLTDAAGLNSDPEWSANGKKVVFVNCSDTTGQTCGGGIYRMNADGSGEVLLERNGYFPSWFPTSNKIAFESYGERPEGFGIYAMSFDASGNPTGATLLTNDGQCPVVSPDGTKIAFLSTRDGQGMGLWVMRAAPEGATNQPVKLVGSMPFGCPTHDWSPDGKRIAYTPARSYPDGSSKPRDVWVMNADGTGKTNITKTPDAWEEAPAFSPDGTKIAFTGYRDGDAHSTVWKMGADGSDPTRLTDSPGLDPDWRPLP
jgi:Tol biopolymer transport system component